MEKGSGLAIRQIFIIIDIMARPLRVEIAGGLYHVTSRGDGREDIYFDDVDRQAWLQIRGQVCERFNWVCHAWCSHVYHSRPPLLKNRAG